MIDGTDPRPPSRKTWGRYTAEEIREFAGVRLERFINPRAVRWI